MDGMNMVVHPCIIEDEEKWDMQAKKIGAVSRGRTM
jgi:hypothetical protein